MSNTMISSSSSQSNLEGTLLTKEQVDEISTRISNKVLDTVLEQLEKSISTASSGTVRAGEGKLIHK